MFEYFRLIAANRNDFEQLLWLFRNKTFYPSNIPSQPSSSFDYREIVKLDSIDYSGISITVRTRQKWGNGQFQTSVIPTADWTSKYKMSVAPSIVNLDIDYRPTPMKTTVNEFMSYDYAYYTPPALVMTFGDTVDNVFVGAIDTLSMWNTFFEDASNATGNFKELQISNNRKVVKLLGGSNVYFKGFNGLNITGATLISFIDNIGCITKLNSNVFYEFTTLTTVILPECTYISDSTFYSCAGLASLLAPKVTTIESLGFYGVDLPLSSLTSLNFPVLTTLGINVFPLCTALQTFTAPMLTTLPAGAFNGCSTMTTLNIGAVTGSIGNGALSNCSSLTGVINWPGVTSIGTSVFNNCTSLTSITLSGVTTIASNAFRNCSNATTISLNSLLTISGSSAFQGCAKVTSFSFPNLTTAAQTLTFSGCTLATTFNMPACTTIGSSFFANCTSMTTCNIGACTNIGGTTGNNTVFSGISGKTITLTVATSRMTANAGNPDGDIVALQGANTVTVVQV